MIITLIIIVVLLSAIIGALNASEDKFMFHWHKSIFIKIDEFWKVKFNTKFYFRHFFSQDSWKNKYIQRHYENGIRRVVTFKLHPAFTDWFHFSKSSRLILEWIQLILFSLIGLNYNFNLNIFIFLIGSAIALFLIRNFSFNLFFNKLLNGRK
jgi:hypothetical protein